MTPARTLPWVLAAALLWPLAQTRAADAPATMTAASRPTAAEVMQYTQPLVRARLRLPDSLHAFVVDDISPATDDPARFQVAVRFRAKTPFGATTENRARFWMKRGAGNAGWIVTTR